MTGALSSQLSDDNCLLLTLTVLVVAVRLPGDGGCALPTGDPAVRLRGQAGVVGGPRQTPRLDDQTARNTPTH